MAHLIPADDDLKSVAQSTLQTIEQRGLNRYKPADQPKAFIHTWLAWQKNPGMPMGQAITAHVLQHDPDLSRRFVAWLNKLFSLTVDS